MSCKAVAAGIVLAGLAIPPASAQLFIYPPDFSGLPVTGAEPGISLPLPGATADELRASLIWNLRAGLNVAALQCQFSPTLMTVRNYNELLRHQKVELEQARKTMETYFKRTVSGKAAAALRAFDQYTTRTYNGFSTLHGQLGFCNTAGQLGRAALGTPKGGLHILAAQRLREFKNSLIPIGDRLFGVRRLHMPVERLDDPCLDRKGRRKKKC